MQQFNLIPSLSIIWKWFHKTELTFLLYTSDISEILSVLPGRTYARLSFNEERDLWLLKVTSWTGSVEFSFPLFWKPVSAICWLLITWSSGAGMSFLRMCTSSFGGILECLLAGKVELFPTLWGAVWSNDSVESAETCPEQGTASSIIGFSVLYTSCSCRYCSLTSFWDNMWCVFDDQRILRGPLLEDIWYSSTLEISA